MNDDDIRTLVARLARPHRSGGDVIERAAIFAEGSDAGAVLAWIVAREGQPEAPVVAATRGLHSARVSNRQFSSAGPTRYVLPPGALS